VHLTPLCVVSCPTYLLRARSVAARSRSPRGFRALRAWLREKTCVAQTEKVAEFFLEREAAEAMLREVREDEPALADDLRVEAIELGGGAAIR
jgi:hypothetical protein